MPPHSKVRSARARYADGRLAKTGDTIRGKDKAGRALVGRVVDIVESEWGIELQVAPIAEPVFAHASDCRRAAS